ncbi:hypothetical protein DV096_16765 [Bradymonadaceae bacterium TMQ3]|nr:hypothetical protein DV096_16765 [Bradymonadaceae bacterium TMQ3]TXC69363.1 hypothetical protein FRC91_17345 [Bradymonadales bacterium TMQ1]
MKGGRGWFGVALLMTVVGVGCAADRGGDDGTSEVASARAPVEDEESRAANARYAVTVVSDGELETRVYDGLGSQHSAFAGLVVPGATGMWRWEEGSRQVAQPDCGCVSEQMMEGAEAADPKACMTDRAVITGRFINDTTGESWAPEETTMAPDDRWWEVSMTPVGAVGSVGLVTLCVDSYYCGAAHPGVECEQIAMDFSGGQPVKVELEALSAALGAESFEGLKLGLEEDVEVAAEDAELVALSPSWDAEEGRLMAEQHYAFGACYACSDGEWSSYTVSTYVAERPLKVEVAGERPPQGLRDLLSASGWEVRAVSPVPRMAVATPAVD